MASTQEPDAYTLVYGNMVNSENAAGYVQHVSGSVAVEFSEDPRSIRLHGDLIRPITLSEYQRSFSHVARDELIADSDLVDAESFEEFMEDEPYEDTENRGFLTIEEDAGYELNAVLVSMTEEDLDFYEKAEMGYHLEEVGEGGCRHQSTYSCCGKPHYREPSPTGATSGTASIPGKSGVK